MRPRLRATMPGRRSFVRCVRATTFTSIISNSPRNSVSTNGPVSPRPALFTSASMVSPLSVNILTMSAAASGLARSATMTWATIPCALVSSVAIVRSVSLLRATRTTSHPSRAKSRVRSRPIPLEAPVMRAVSFMIAYVTISPMQRHRTAALALAVTLSALASAQPNKIVIPAKKAPTHEALWLMKRVGAPAPSPDGKWVIASVTEPSYDEKEQSSDLWLVPVDGSTAPRPITHTKAAEADVVWSPDSKTIAFSSKREGDDVAQIYLLDVANGGEARRITTLSTGARAPQFRPDGAALSIQSTVYPGAADDEANKKIAKERKDQKYKVRTYDSFPIRQWDRWLDDLQTHLVLITLDPATGKTNVPPNDIFAGTKLAAMPGFATHFSARSHAEHESAWTPDGTNIVFSATTSRNVSAYAEVPYDLYLTAGGEPKILTDGKGRYGGPRFAPDGKTLFVPWEPLNKKQYNNTRLVRFDWSGLTNQVNNRNAVTDVPFHPSLGSSAVTPDGATIHFTAADPRL